MNPRETLSAQLSSTRATHSTLHQIAVMNYGTFSKATPKKHWGIVIGALAIEPNHAETKVIRLRMWDLDWKADTSAIAPGDR